MNDAEDWARWDADNLVHDANRLRHFFRQNGRLPYPAGGKVRQAYDMLGEIVAGMDETMKEGRNAA